MYSTLSQTYQCEIIDWYMVYGVLSPRDSDTILSTPLFFPYCINSYSCCSFLSLQLLWDANPFYSGDNVIDSTRSVKFPRFPMLLGMGPLNWFLSKFLDDPNIQHNINTFHMNHSCILRLCLCQPPSCLLSLLPKSGFKASMHLLPRVFKHAF